MVLVLGMGLMMVAQLLRRYPMVSSALAGGADGQGRSYGQHGRGPRGHLHSRRHGRYSPCFDESSSIPKSFAVLSWK
jgi:hypothetical protein